MLRLACPECGESGQIGARDRGFEPREAPVNGGSGAFYWCLQCGGGLVVSPRRLGLGVRVERVDPSAWRRAESSWGREGSATTIGTDANADPERLIEELRSTVGDSEQLVHLVAEALDRSHAEVRSLLAREDRGPAAA